MLKRYLGLSVWGIHKGYFWQVFTYMFMHDSFWHLFFNMFGLYFFGREIEKYYGSREFLLFYLLCGIGSGIFTALVYNFSHVYPYLIVIGASGAIYGLLLAFATIYPRAVIYIWGIIPIRAPIMVLIFVLFAIWNTLTQSNGNVANLTHLFGVIVATLIFVVRYRINPIEEFRSGGQGGNIRW